MVKKTVDGRARLLVGGLFLVVGAVLIGFAVIRDDPARPDASPITTTTTTTEVDRSWPPDLSYRPMAFGSDASNPPAEIDPAESGLHLWLDFEGWFLWDVGTNRPGRFVEIEVDGEVPLEGIRTVGNAEATLVEPDRLLIGFPSGGPTVSGVRFNPGFFTRTIRIEAEPADAILLGIESVPAPIPLEIGKGRPLPTD